MFHVKHEIMKGLIKGAIALLNQVLEHMESDQDTTLSAAKPMGSAPPDEPVGT